jgi:hypothetical protein
MLDRKLVVCGELGCISTVEVVMRPSEVFVRPLLHEEAVRLKRLSKRAKHQCTRHREITFESMHVYYDAVQADENMLKVADIDRRRPKVAYHTKFPRPTRGCQCFTTRRMLCAIQGVQRNPRR